MSLQNPTSAIEVADDQALIRLYQTDYGRQPDLTGLTYWDDQMVNHGVSLQSVSAAFSLSSEFTTRYASASPATFLDTLYHDTLGRDADVTGFTYWLGQLASGVTQAQVALDFSQSAEYINDAAAGVTQIMTNLSMGIAPDPTHPLPGIPVYHAPALSPGNPADVATLVLSQALHNVTPANGDAFSSGVASFDAASSTNTSDSLAGWKAEGVELFNASANSFTSLEGKALVDAEVQSLFGTAATSAQEAQYGADLSIEQSIYGDQGGKGAELGVIAAAAVAANTNVATAAHTALANGFIDWGTSLFSQTPATSIVDVPTAGTDTITYGVGVSADVLAENPAHPGTLLTGSGIPNSGLYTSTDANTGIQLFMQDSYRTSATQFTLTGVDADNTVHVTGQAGLQNGSNGEQGSSTTRDNLALTFGAVGGVDMIQNNQIKLFLGTDTGGVATYTTELDLHVIGGQQIWTTPSGTPVIPDDPQSLPNSVAENTANMAFSYWLGNPNAAVAGHYDALLTVTPLVGLAAGTVTQSLHEVITLT